MHVGAALSFPACRPGVLVLLDGIGTGLDLPVLLPALHHYIGVDLDERCSIGLAHASPCVGLVEGDGEALPFANACFDHAILHLILAARRVGHDRQDQMQDRVIEARVRKRQRLAVSFDEAEREAGDARASPIEHRSGQIHADVVMHGRQIRQVQACADAVEQDKLPPVGRQGGKAAPTCSAQRPIHDLIVDRRKETVAGAERHACGAIVF